MNERVQECTRESVSQEGGSRSVRLCPSSCVFIQQMFLERRFLQGPPPPWLPGARRGQPGRCGGGLGCVIHDPHINSCWGCRHPRGALGMALALSYGERNNFVSCHVAK